MKTITVSKRCDAKVLSIFRDLVGERAELLDGLASHDDIESLVAKLGRAYPCAVARDVAFHVLDWKLNAAFIIAFQLFPERFTASEVRAGITNLVVHAPNHLAAAAKLTGHPISDVFGLNVLAHE